jgi:hypothetical protein
MPRAAASPPVSEPRPCPSAARAKRRPREAPLPSVLNWKFRMLRIFTCAMMFAFLSLTWAARPATPAKKSAKKSTKSTTKSSKSSSKKSSGKNTRATTWRNRQMAPTPERYRQIQEALAAKGYLRPEDATGVWTPASADALKRFQMEQKIESNGKINSLSLIALGLGPKRETPPDKPSPPVQ